MPGRKSNVSTVSNGPEEVAESTPARQPKEKDKDGLSVDDLSLPKSMVARLAKGVLPANTQIHKDALLALHKSATVFVSYLASNSNENAQAAGKKTIAPHDVIAALKDAELHEFIPRLEQELKKYNETQCDKRNTYRRKVKEEKAAAAVKDGEGDSTLPLDEAGADVETTNGITNGHADDAAENEHAEPPAKKLKRENGDGVPLDADDMEEDEEAEDEEQDANDQEDDAEDDNVVEDDVDDEDDDPDETMEDALEEQEETEDRIELQDEALDEPDSD